MYPNALFLGIDLYEIMLIVAFLSALFYFRLLADRVGFDAFLQNLCITGGLAGLIGGYFAAVLTQAIYNAQATGHFALTEDTGATFYGGLIGGAAFYLLVYFAIGRGILKRKEPTQHFWQMSSIAAGCIALAHGFGRIGCLCAGCCHGKITEAWYGIYNAQVGARTVPLPLFETIFLWALCAGLTWNTLKRKRQNGLAWYLILYAVWRFCIEFFRADDRGAALIPALSPSQTVAILLFTVGILLWFVERKTNPREGNDAT